MIIIVSWIEYISWMKLKLKIYIPVSWYYYESGLTLGGTDDQYKI